MTPRMSASITGSGGSANSATSSAARAIALAAIGPETRGHRVEVTPALPVHVGVDQALECLVHESRRLQGMIAPLAAHAARRDPAQLRIDDRHDLGEGLVVSGAPLGEKTRNGAGFRHAIGHKRLWLFLAAQIHHR